MEREPPVGPRCFSPVLAWRRISSHSAHGEKILPIFIDCGAALFSREPWPLGPLFGNARFRQTDCSVGSREGGAHTLSCSDASRRLSGSGLPTVMPFAGRARSACGSLTGSRGLCSGLGDGGIAGCITIGELGIAALHECARAAFPLSIASASAPMERDRRTGSMTARSTSAQDAPLLSALRLFCRKPMFATATLGRR